MTTPSSQLVWLITGTSSGFGRDLAIAALNRGDKVIATTRTRSISQLDGLKALGAETLELDVSASVEQLKQIAAKAVGTYGRVDVLVNNAGYIQAGTIEESLPEETLQQFNTNVFGALNVSRAFLPYMRERRTGTIIFIGSIAGWQTIPIAGIYCATKFAIRGLSLALHEDIAPLGLRSICIDLGYFRTPLLEQGHRTPWISRIEDYRPMSERADAIHQASNGKQPGDPKRGAETLVDVVRGEGSARGKLPPRVLALGSDCYEVVKAESEKTLQILEEWKETTMNTDFLVQV